MKDQVIVGPMGDIAIAVPLYKLHESDSLKALDGYYIQLTSNRPTAYVIDLGKGPLHLVAASAVEKQCEFLGDL